MDELTQRNSNQIENEDSTIRRILVNIDHLILILNNDSNDNLNNSSPDQHQQQLSSTTITNVTINDDNHQLIEHLRYRIDQLEHERNVLLTSYQLLIKLLK